ncbi:MAG: hypothetical protein M3Y72_04550 [Acidobacteriota bacterium]|nr:hypothetical protein [Acidobacteriota bacterium]
MSAVSFTIPEAVYIGVFDFDRGKDGIIILCGKAYDSKGRLASFIGRITPNGESSQVIRTAPFSPHLISEADDGTIWTVGLESINGDENVPGVNPNGDVLRHFDSSGKLIASAFPRPRIAAGRLVTGYLVATADRLAWYAPADGRGTYAELSSEGKLLDEYPGMTDRSGRATGFALTSTGKAYLTFSSFKWPASIQP